jgi:UDPglucose 6-dehydrogenase
MKVGFIGLGKLGLPCALAIDSFGHDVFGFDIDENVKKILEDRNLPYRESGSQELLQNHKIKWSSIKEVVENSEIIFVPIQTPHLPMYEGDTRIPSQREDFNYEFLKNGINLLSDEIEKQNSDKIVIIISTVLPGTIRREIKPLLSEKVKLCYNPFFIAMGTTIKDFTSPEFVLFGVDDNSAYERAKYFYSTIHNKPVYKCTIEEAELIKVTYNTYITMKVCLANTIMELSHKLENINCDNVMKGLFLANERLISPKYLLGGMGDGGGCHPRDNIALSWLSQKVNLSFDWYDNLMKCREEQTEWLAELIIENHKKTNLPVIILGKTFKKETNLLTGSPSILLKNILIEQGISVNMYDPWIDEKEPPLNQASIYFIGTNHDVFLNYEFPKKSIVIDPWRYIKRQIDIELISIGDSTKQ